jgi:hypothetical protein
MATCSFLKATDAINLSRNNTVIWTEICELQQAILAAIDSNSRSVIVSEGTPFTFLSGIATATLDSGGSGYSIDTAVATINANGTGGTLATVTPSVSSTGVITGFDVTNGGSGYVPVSATASLATPVILIGATVQDETFYQGGGTNGTFVRGDDYVVGEVITLNDTPGSTITVDAITTTGYVTTAGQTQANYDDVVPSATANGSFTGGSGYADGDTITLNDGTLITVVTAAAGVVTVFTVTTASTSSASSSGATRVQSSTSGSGVGFTLTTDTNNEILVGQVTQFSVTTNSGAEFFLLYGLQQESTTGIGAGFALTPNTANVTTGVGGSGAIITPIVTNGVVTSIVIDPINNGTGYLPNNPVLITHPSGSGFSGLVSSVGVGGEVEAITITNGGNNYGTVSATVTVAHSTGFGFEGTVVTSGGVVTGISVQDGGQQYGDVYPYIVVSDATGSGAEINVTGVSGGAITSIQLADGGYNYSDTPSVLIYNYDGTQNSTATITLTTEADTFNNPNDPSDYYLVLSGQASDVVVSDQLQYVLDYFTALGYNIRAQVNPATNNTIQWQIIW